MLSWICEKCLTWTTLCYFYKCSNNKTRKTNLLFCFFLCALAQTLLSCLQKQRPLVWQPEALPVSVSPGLFTGCIVYVQTDKDRDLQGERGKDSDRDIEREREGRSDRQAAKRRKAINLTAALTVWQRSMTKHWIVSQVTCVRELGGMRKWKRILSYTAIIASSNEYCVCLCVVWHESVCVWRGGGTCVSVCMHTCIPHLMYWFTCICISTDMHAYINTNTYTQSHTHTHTHTQSHILPHSQNLLCRYEPALQRQQTSVQNGQFQPGPVTAVSSSSGTSSRTTFPHQQHWQQPQDKQPRGLRQHWLPAKATSVSPSLDDVNAGSSYLLTHLVCLLIFFYMEWTAGFSLSLSLSLWTRRYWVSVYLWRCFCSESLWSLACIWYDQCLQSRVISTNGVVGPCMTTNQQYCTHRCTFTDYGTGTGQSFFLLTAMYIVIINSLSVYNPYLAPSILFVLLCV